MQSHSGVSSANVLAVDEDIGHSALLGDVQQQALDISSIGCGIRITRKSDQRTQQNSQRNQIPTSRVQLHDLRLDAQLLEQRLDARAVRAVSLGEHEHLLLSDGGLEPQASVSHRETESGQR